MKRTLWTLLLALGVMLALCVSASATTTAEDFYNALVVGGTIKLENDVIYDKPMEVVGTLTIDLNGYVLTIPQGICVNSSAQLTITDSNPNATHKFTPNSDGLWVLAEDGSETVTGGIITGGKGYQYHKTHPTGDPYIIEAGGGVCVKSGGKLTMEGGNIVGCMAPHGTGGGVYVEGEFSMTGGSITGCFATRGGGVYMAVGDGEAAFNMSGNAVIRDCRCTGSGIAGGGGVNALGSFTMSGNAAIRNCKCSSNAGSAMGGGVYVAYHNGITTFTMSGNAVIEKCKVMTASQGSWIKSYGGGVYGSSGSSLTLSDHAAIRNCSAENTSGGATHGGGIFVDSGNLTIKGNAEIGEGCTAGIGSGIYMGMPTYSSASQKLYANGGVIKGEVVLNNGSDCGGTINVTGSGEDVTKFESPVINNSGTIERGTFTGTVTNNGSITGGEFTDTVTNNGSITGGTFTETVINSESGTIAEGVSINSLQFIVTFDIEDVKTTQTVDNGSKLTEPTAPTKEGYHFDGWYYDDNGRSVKWNFDDTVTRAMTLTAKWAQIHAVTVTTDGGGTASANPSSASVGAEITLTATPDKGYHFKEWQVVSPAELVIADNKFTMPDDDVEVKAVFEKDAPVVYYTLRFETRGGSAIAGVRGTYNTYIDLTEYVPTWRGHTFTGWYSDSGLTKRVSGVYLTEDTTVYAGWRTTRSTVTTGSAVTTDQTGTKELESPQTGDGSMLGLWGSTLCASLAGCLTLAAWQIRRRRGEGDQK